MRNLFVLLLLSFASIPSKGQYPCLTPIPENLRPDTITTYIFPHSNKTVPTSEIPAAKVLSNYSFKTRDFTLNWVPVTARDVRKFAEKSLENEKRVDTLKCLIFELDYTVIVIRSKRKTWLWMYRDSNGKQDIFAVALKNKRKITPTLEFLASNLK